MRDYIGPCLFLNFLIFLVSAAQKVHYIILLLKLWIVISGDLNVSSLKDFL